MSKEIKKAAEAPPVYQLTRSIIHNCPALVLPNEFLRKFANMAQIVPMKCSQDVAEEIVAKLNAAQSAPAQEGGK